MFQIDLVWQRSQLCIVELIPTQTKLRELSGIPIWCVAHIWHRVLPDVADTQCARTCILSIKKTNKYFIIYILIIFSQ